MSATGTNYTDLTRYCSKQFSDVHNGIVCTARALTEPDYWKEY